jgi:hypothetical protein
MERPHCRVHIHERWEEAPLGGMSSPNGPGLLMPATNFGPEYVWFQRATLCPNCKGLIVDIFAYNVKNKHKTEYERAFPNRRLAPEIDKSVPSHIKQDYIEASAVLDVSARGSAALSRRCLQNVLRDNGYRAKDLANEINMLYEDEIRPILVISPRIQPLSKDRSKLSRWRLLKRNGVLRLSANCLSISTSHLQ